MNSILIILIQLVFNVVLFAILIKVILSWLPALTGTRIDPYHPVIRVIDAITEPILEPLRPYATVDMMDFSPIVALLLLYLIEEILISLLR